MNTETNTETNTKTNVINERRHRRTSSFYDHNQYKREIYETYILSGPLTAEPAEIIETTETSSSATPKTPKTPKIPKTPRTPRSLTAPPTAPISHYSYSCTGFSSPTLHPFPDRLLEPPSSNERNGSRDHSPFGRDIGKDITNNLLFGDNINN